jgi:AbiV family abortive infection protein
MVKGEVKIPTCKVAEGVNLCIENSLQFCSDAKSLCDVKSFNHAWALCILAVEELGKAVWLKSLKKSFIYHQNI